MQEQVLLQSVLEQGSGETLQGLSGVFQNKIFQNGLEAHSYKTKQMQIKNLVNQEKRRKKGLKEGLSNLVQDPVINCCS